MTDSLIPLSQEKSPPSGPTELPRNVKLLGWASFLNDVASEAVYPLIPQFLLSLGGNRAHLGLIEGLADSVASLLKLWSGSKSDQAGSRKPFMVFGYLLTVLARPLLGATHFVWQVAAVRVADRIGKGIRTAPRDALIADSTDEHLRGAAFGYHRAMDHLGAAVGPILATLFLWFLPGELRWLMLLTILPGIGVLLIQVFGVREANRSPRDKTAPKQSWRRPRGPFAIYLVALVLFTLANSSDTFLLLRASELGVATVWLPILWCAFNLTKSLGNRLAGSAADRWSPRGLILLGWVCYAAVYLGFALATQAWHAWFLFLAYAVFFALTEPAEKKLVAWFARDGETGQAFGWFHTALGLTNLPSSLLFGLLYEEYGASIAFIWGAAMAIVASVALLACNPHRVR